MNNNDRSRFVEYDAHPKKFCRIDCVGTAVHSLSVAKSKTWIESYNELIDASGQLGLMPDDKKVVALMLKNNGFFQQPGSAEHRSVNKIIRTARIIVLRREGTIRGKPRFMLIKRKTMIH